MTAGSNEEATLSTTEPMFRLWLEDPTKDVDKAALVDTPIAEADEARARADQIRAGVKQFAVDVAPLIVKAFLRRDWAALSYPSWEEYVRAEFKIEDLFTLVDRPTAIHYMSMAGMSSRAIAGATGVSPRTVGRVLEGSTVEAGRDAAVDRPAQLPEGHVVGSDGKVRKARGRRKQADPPADDTASADPKVGANGGPTSPATIPGAADEVAYPERDAFLEQGSIPPAVFSSATPGSRTADTPAPAVSYDGWRRMAGDTLAHVERGLATVTGDYADPVDFAGRADEQLVERLSTLGQRLTRFLAEVLEQRADHRLVWVSASTGHSPVGERSFYHTPDPDNLDSDPVKLTACGRSMLAGSLVPEAEARVQLRATPCGNCATALDQRALDGKD